MPNWPTIWRCDVQETITAFGGSSPPPPPPTPAPAPAPPTVDPADLAAQAKAAEQARISAEKGRAATLLTPGGAEGDTTGEKYSASKKLLGA